MTKLSNRVHKVKPSFTLQMATIAADMKSKGMDVINFSVGEPDFNTPSNIVDAAIQAMKNGHTRYTPGGGTKDLKLVLANSGKKYELIFSGEIDGYENFKKLEYSDMK